MSRFASWGIIIDDIVFPDGRTAMGVLGGGGLYAAIGMRLWSRDVVLISAVGQDFEINSLEPFGLNGSGILVTDLPTPRAWQLFEEDGRRTQIFRVPDEVWYEQLVLPPSVKPFPLLFRPPISSAGGIQMRKNGCWLSKKLASV